MGRTAKYVMVTQQELQLLLVGGGQNIVDDLYEERYGVGPRFAPSKNDFQNEIEANPLLLLNHEKFQAAIGQLFSQLREQEALSQQRLWSGDRDEYLEEICRLYALGQRRWERCDSLYQEGNHFQAFRQFAGFTEDDLVREAMKLGYHLWLDLDNFYDYMHELLTGMTLKERSDYGVLLSAMPFIEQAKQNASFPSGSLTNIEEARNAIHAMKKEVERVWKELEHKVNQFYCETDDCPEELCDLLKAVEKIRLDVAEAVTALYTSLLSIAALQKDNDNTAIQVHHSDFAEADKCTRAIQSLSTGILLKIRASELAEAELSMAKTLREKAVEIKRLVTIKVRSTPWESYFSEPRSNDKSIGDIDLLSMAVTGGPYVPGVKDHYPKYITDDQTKAIAQLLEPLTSHGLASEHDLTEFADWEEFYQFKKFYLRAAQFEAGVLVFLD